jgi:hypothetical protein
VETPDPNLADTAGSRRRGWTQKDKTHRRQ